MSQRFKSEIVTGLYGVGLALLRLGLGNGLVFALAEARRVVAGLPVSGDGGVYRDLGIAEQPITTDCGDALGYMLYTLGRFSGGCGLAVQRGTLCIQQIGF